MSEPEQNKPQGAPECDANTAPTASHPDASASPIAPDAGRPAAPSTRTDAASTPVDSRDKSAADIPESEVSQAILKTDMPVEGKPNDLAYGAMDNQFPPDYDPYIFGRPESGETHEQVEREARDEEIRLEQRRAQQRRPNPMAMSPAAGYERSSGASRPGQNADPNAPFGDRRNYGADNRGKLPRYVQGIDLDDPNQNVYYGRWDTSSIIAFALSLLLPVPFLPALLGAFGMYRTKLMRMKGFGFALAAVIINVIYSIAMIWMMINGVSTQDVLNDMLHMLGLNGTAGGSSPAPTGPPTSEPAPSPSSTGGASGNGVTSAMGM
ncbi:hypothetical protein B1400_0850 [Bifidobacterium italicum]|uniref:DUF4190 domain-containing protein n=1 Tax=Bifidobacterium italicum TaxID=1960968 RepID=A0A2A2EJS5_9BIFI|nr:hypothetical protein [Bifidobacterium italicum]PAU69484.1 hypothetical protein B1400_0850 [Bifidobacterium italicum]